MSLCFSLIGLSKELAAFSAISWMGSQQTNPFWARHELEAKEQRLDSNPAQSPIKGGLCLSLTGTDPSCYYCARFPAAKYSGHKKLLLCSCGGEPRIDWENATTEPENRANLMRPLLKLNSATKGWVSMDSNFFDQSSLLLVPNLRVFFSMG